MKFRSIVIATLGILAPGIGALADAGHSMAITPLASPETPQSAVGSSRS